MYFVELTVHDPAVSAAWYRDVLGLPQPERFAGNDFALLSAAPIRLALKRGSPLPGGVLLAFAVEDLDGWLGRLAGRGVTTEGLPAVSREGYRRVRLRDPDGYAVSLFEWLPQQPGGAGAGAPTPPGDAAG